MPIRLYKSGQGSGLHPVSPPSTAARRMIVTFGLWLRASAHVGSRLRLILARLDAIMAAEDMNLPGLSLHPLKGSLKNFWLVSVSGNWRVIFRFESGYVLDVDYLDYH